MRRQVNKIIDNHHTSSGRLFAYGIQLLIILSIVAFSVETLPDLKPEFRQYLRYFEYFCIAVFTAEYLLRLYAAPSKTGFVFSFFGLIDLIAILPFYLSLGVDLRSMRALRLLRLFRLLKLARYNQTIIKFTRALRYAREELVIFLVITIIVIYLAAVGIYYFENAVQPDKFKSVFHSLWWAVATLTTVGYGDIYPITVGGKIFTFVILLIGLSIVAIPAGIISSALTKALEEKGRRGE